MKKIVKIEFSEQSKSVTGDCRIEYELEGTELNISNEEILAETKQLYDKVFEYSQNMTKKKMI